MILALAAQGAQMLLVLLLAPLLTGFIRKLKARLLRRRVDELIGKHKSIERALVQIPMPRMSTEETSQIVQNGLARLAMRISDDALDEVSSLSQGLPYITHLLSPLQQ